MNEAENLTQNYGDLGGCYPPRPTVSTDNTPLDLHNSSQDTQPHSLIVKYASVQIHSGETCLPRDFPHSLGQYCSSC